MSKSKKKTLGIAIILIVLCIALFIGGTYALFSDNITKENHLQAGTLEIGLQRTSLTKTYLDETTGYLKEYTDSEVVDFTNATEENVFGIESDELVVPGSAYEAKMKITNKGSVAFSYIIKLKLKTDVNELAKQMKIYVDEEDKGYLSDYLQTNNEVSIATGEMTTEDGNEKTLTIKIEFEDLSNNNAAQNEEVLFDLIVDALQQTSRTN